MKSKHFALWYKDVIYNPGDPDKYMTRLCVFELPWFNGTKIGLKHHIIHKSDPDRHLHNHPFKFISLILRGQYLEERDSGMYLYGPGCFNFFTQKDQYHRLDVPENNTVSSLIFYWGKETDNWGFKVNGGHVHWRGYLRNHKLYNAETSTS